MNVKPLYAVIMIIILSAGVAGLFAYSLDLPFLKVYAFVVASWATFQIFIPAKYRS